MSTTAGIAARRQQAKRSHPAIKQRLCSRGCARTKLMHVADHRVSAAMHGAHHRVSAAMHVAHHRVSAAQVDEVAAMGDNIPGRVEAKLLSHLAKLGSTLWVQGLGLPLPLAACVQRKGIAPCRQAVRSGNTPCCQVSHHIEKFSYSSNPRKQVQDNADRQGTHRLQQH